MAYPPDTDFGDMLVGVPPAPPSLSSSATDDRITSKVRVSKNGRMVVRITDTGPPNEDGSVPMAWEELYGLNWHEFDNLLGRLLTLADATFHDPVQRKAFKDMVRQNVKEWVSDIATDAAHDAGVGGRVSTAPFVGGILD